MKAKGEVFPKGRLLQRQQLYSGKIVDLVVDQIELSDGIHIREVVRHPGGVLVLALLPDRTIPFVRQLRYPMDTVLLELPAGKIDQGEEPEICAARELEEETGYRPRKLELVSRFYSSPGFCDELLYLYYCDSVKKTTPRNEPGEAIQVECYTLEHALEMAASGEILDAKTLVALYWLHWKQRS